MKILNGDRAELVRKQKEALVRFVCSTHEPQSGAAMQEVTSIGRRLRRRGALTLVSDETGKTRGRDQA